MPHEQFNGNQPLLRNYIAVLDFETCGKNPYTCYPVQLAVTIMNPFTFQTVEGADFCTYIKVPNCTSTSFKDDNLDSLIWHATNYECEIDDIIQNWNKGLNINDTIHALAVYLNKYNLNGPPILAGYNICGFDDIILRRYCEKLNYLDKEGRISFFNPVYKLDLMYIALSWFGTFKDIQSLSLDNLREYLGLKKDGAHDALFDVKQEALILSRFLAYQRRQTAKTTFKGSLNNA